MVFNVRPLWDKRHKEHHNRYILAKEWKKIGAELGMTGKFYLSIYFVLFSKRLCRIPPRYVQYKIGTDFV